MNLTIKQFAIIAATLLCPAAVMAAEPMTASVRISGGGVYDYAVIGESPKATDLFDNAYDISSPGPGPDSTYIRAYFAHPEWTSRKKELKGDIRSLAGKQQWVLSIATTLPAGTPLVVELDTRLNILPAGLELTVKDNNGTTANLLTGGQLTVPSSAPGTPTQLIITALQQGGAPWTPLEPGTYATDGDVDGDGQTTIFDAVAVLRIAYGQDPVSAAALTHGDVDGDGSLRLADALAIMRKSVGL